MTNDHRLRIKHKIFSLTNFLIVLLVIRFVAGVFYSLVPVHGLHIWRQTDVLSVAYSYYLRYFVEGNFSHFFLPSVLNTDHGELSIVKMEFPLLNFAISPAFIFGPYWGRVIANITLLTINYALMIFNYRMFKDVKIYGVSAANAVLLLLNFSFTATWTTRMLPDVMSMLLVLGAVSASWVQSRPYTSTILASLGMLMKPTSLILLLLNLCKQDTFLETIRSRKLWCDCLYSIASVLIAMSYYFIALKYIGQLQVHKHFAVDLFNPLTQLISVFNSNDQLGLKYLFSVRFLCPPYIVWMIPYVANIQVMLVPYLGLILGSIVMLIHLIFTGRIIAWRAILIGIVQCLIIMVLDGEHSFVHFYYYVGTSFAFALVFVGYLERAPKFSRILLWLIIFLQMADIINFEIGDYFTHHFQWTPVSRVAFYDECSLLKHNHSDLPWGRGYVFNGPILDNQQAADLGICFGERERLNGAQYGFYYLWDEIPANCQIIDSTEHINLTKCE